MGADHIAPPAVGQASDEGAALPRIARAPADRHEGRPARRGVRGEDDVLGALPLARLFRHVPMNSAKAAVYGVLHPLASMSAGTKWSVTELR